MSFPFGLEIPEHTPITVNTDLYKEGHWLIMPDDAQKTFVYGGSRGGFNDRVRCFGPQKSVKELLMRPATKEDVQFGKWAVDEAMGPGIFNYDGWMRIVNKHGGYLPVEVRAIPEGYSVPTKTAMLTMESTDDKLPWVAPFIEPPVLRDLWYGSTTATVSDVCRTIIKAYLDKYSDDKEHIKYALIDFGSRGVSSDQGGQFGTLAHLSNDNFSSDSVAAYVSALKYYNYKNCKEQLMASVIASEHGVMGMLADIPNRNDFAAAERMVSILERRVKEYGGFQIVSIVADLFSQKRMAREHIGTTLRDRIVNSGGRVVLRPDSGDPLTVPIEMVQILMEQFGYTINSKGLKVLPPCIRVLQGDGITYKTLETILKNAVALGISPCNFLFGMGGGLLQHSDRDWLKFALKSSAWTKDGINWIDILKDPDSDPGKTSFTGRVTTVRTIGDEIVTKRLEDVLHTDIDLMNTIYRNGVLLIDWTFDQVRDNYRNFTW